MKTQVDVYEMYMPKAGAFLIPKQIQDKWTIHKIYFWMKIR